MMQTARSALVFSLVEPGKRPSDAPDKDSTAMAYPGGLLIPFLVKSNN
jgi:hypothetical protein